jgi:spermidine/putrescine ABC transporter ATP-binding subunit
MSYLDVSGLTKSYDGTLVLNGVDLAVDRGEFVSLLGPSGCGKTTILRLLAGFTHADSGQVTLDGEQIEGVPSYKRDIGFVFQDYALFPHLDVAHNVAFGLGRRKVPKAEMRARVDRILEVVQLGRLANRHPHQLSGGQRQRVALARAMVVNPRLLLLDESLSALDKKMRVDMQVELREIQQKLGITTIFVTHDQEEAMTMSDRIAVMRTGRIAQLGTPTEIYHRPTDGYVARAVGDINLLDAVVTGSGVHGVRARLDDGSEIDSNASPSTWHSGDQVTVGIRPQDLRIARRQPPGASVRARVSYLSFAGSTWNVGVEAVGRPLKVQADGSGEMLQGVGAGDEVWLTWERTSVHLLTGSV